MRLVRLSQDGHQQGPAPLEYWRSLHDWSVIEITDRDVFTKEGGSAHYTAADLPQLRREGSTEPLLFSVATDRGLLAPSTIAALNVAIEGGHLEIMPSAVLLEAVTGTPIHARDIDGLKIASEVDQLVLEKAQALAKEEAAHNGRIWLLLGASVSVVSLLLAFSAGGRFYIWWGAAFVGVYMMTKRPKVRPKHEHAAQAAVLLNQQKDRVEVVAPFAPPSMSYDAWIAQLDAHLAKTNLPTRHHHFRQSALEHGHLRSMSPVEFLRSGYDK